MKTGRLLLLSIPAALILVCCQRVKMVEVKPTSIKLTSRSQTAMIEAKALDLVGKEVSGVGFTYQSENTSVVTVDTTGAIKAQGNGSTVVIAKTPDGISGESFVKVCLPKDLICTPGDKLVLKVGLAAPIKCRVTDCDDKNLSTKIDLKAADEKIVLKEGENVFIGLQVGDTEVAIKAFDIEKKVGVHVDEQEYLPGMGPGEGGKSGGKGGGEKKEGDPYGGSGGRFDHILKNMKFSN